MELNQSNRGRGVLFKVQRPASSCVGFSKELLSECFAVQTTTRISSYFSSACANLVRIKKEQRDRPRFLLVVLLLFSLRGFFRRVSGCFPHPFCPSLFLVHLSCCFPRFTSSVSSRRAVAACPRGCRGGPRAARSSGRRRCTPRSGTQLRRCRTPCTSPR